MLSRAERMHNQFFNASAPLAWQPPADILETDREVLVFVALPGVDPSAVQAAIEDGHLVISGARMLPPELRTANIHRLELPQGRFQRRLPLPPGRYTEVQRAGRDGCLIVRLEKAAHGR